MKLAFWKRTKAAEPNHNQMSETIVQSNEYKQDIHYDEIGLHHPYQAIAVTDADFYWESLEDEDLAYQDGDSFVLPWEELFQILRNLEHQSVTHLFNLPTSSPFYPILRSEGGVSDPDFKIILEGWSDGNRVKFKGTIKRTGAILEVNGQQYLLNEPTWQLLEKIKEFARINVKNETTNKKYWAKIRSLANKSQANLDEFLRKTIVIDPMKLQLNLRKSLVTEESVVEVQPVFDEAPANWLQIFDGYNEVQNQYTISLPDGGLAHVIIEPQVKSVLNEIKKMPNRRVSGERAQTFLHNPFAQLGDDATEVISPESFEQSKEEAEIYSYNMMIEKIYNDLGYFSSAILILHENSSREQPPITLQLSTIEQAQHFINAYEKPAPIFMWAGYTIDKTGYLEQQVATLKQDLANIQKYEDELQAKKVLDLTNYSARVIGIGEQQKLNPEFIQQDSGDSPWLPESPIEAGTYELNPGDDIIQLLEEMNYILDNL